MLANSIRLLNMNIKDVVSMYDADEIWAAKEEAQELANMLEVEYSHRG